MWLFLWKTAFIINPIYFFEDLLGFKLEVFPGVVLLSRRRLSGFPVDLAVGFGPGLSAMIFFL
jgi:hypothetical protein